MEEEWLGNSMQSFLKRERERDEERKAANSNKGRERERMGRVVEARGLKRGWTVKDMMR